MTLAYDELFNEHGEVRVYVPKSADEIMADLTRAAAQGPVDDPPEG
jgi:hypothetical protein